MKCPKHDKDFVGLCSWCGKQICRACLGSEEKNKKYCYDCAQKIAELKKMPKPEFMKHQPELRQERREPKPDDEFRVETY